ncbi:hypothetical protein AC578_104 [Pseudocercospora eumusae]|uniref:INO80 complex subunit F domain-containing protein n=1 Tax=Pseudocercospora eumusae TaxID=321146 RepID=A0A139HP75_9PEZI|nr:hypothetical protein AC578_104 [Pseudocercospora eumusae]
MAPPGPSAESTMNTPLAPSVEKAYYRKCIQLKRRLNEIEAANDEARMRRLRLDRAIMKMRLERAFLLDELRKRMEYNIDGSDGSGDEGAQTPPPDRPYRDKRRRRGSAGQAPPPANTFQSGQYAFPAAPSVAGPSVAGPAGQAVLASAGHDDGNYGYSESIAQQSTRAAPPPAPLPHGSPYAPSGPPTGVPSGAATRAVNGVDSERPVDRSAGAVGEPVAAGPAVVEDDGERKVAPPAAEGEGSRSAFTAVNQ